MRRLVVMIMLCFTVLSVTVFALPVDGNWHDVTKVSFDVGTTWEWIQATPSSDNVIPVNIPHATPLINNKYVWLCVPLSGDTWQIDPSHKTEVRIFWEVKGNTQLDNSNFPYTSLRGQTKWYQGTAGIAIPNLGGVSDVGAYEYVTKFYNSDFVDGNIKTSMGAYTDIIIPADRFRSDARSIWIPFQISNAVVACSVGISSISIRQASGLTDNQIFTEILNTIQQIADKKGLTQEEVQAAVLGALEQFTAQDQQEANDIKGDADQLKDQLENKLGINGFKDALVDFTGIFDKQSTPFDLTTPSVSLTLSGQNIQILPEISMNLTTQVEQLIRSTKARYPSSSIVFDLVGIVYTISISFGSFKLAVYAVKKALGIGADGGDED